MPLNPAKASSQVDSSFAAKGAYAPLIAGDLQGKQTLEFTLIDSLEAVILENQIPNSQIDAFTSGASSQLDSFMHQVQEGDTEVAGLFATAFRLR